ncbi:GtrA family protein [Francisella philomiragia]|nr:GtrA family protein [Francisella philomiragia]MBK2092322.1 GtrA family protein [Francisella philomiragia]MBK2257396.1 GtrA family protein [Francisella philomiragia]MBK2271991.1 GtrA family protein [Francisella philomiragia]MBK2275772.1 GtrA family protein [Francisella philomiragia]MBK2295351.1 GtrA family protein [Francisella philomiragia]
MKFCIIAAGYNLFAYLIFVIFILLNINYLIASSIAFILGVTLSLFMNKIIVFKGGKYNRVMVVKYFIFYALLLCFNLIVLYFFVKILHVNIYISQVIVIGISAFLSYNVMRIFIFEVV